MAVPDPLLGGDDSANEILNRYIQLARTPEVVMRGSIVRDSHGAITAAAVVWPNGRPGAYVGVASSTFPGATDSYTITYGSPVEWTFRQPTVTRDPSSGAVVTLPEIEVS